MINEAYNESWQQAKDVLEEQGFVLLGQLLAQASHEELLEQLSNQTYEEEHQPALKRYEQGLVPEQAHKLLKNVSQELALNEPTRTQLKKYRAGSFELQDADQAGAGYEYTLFLTKNWNTDWRGENTYAHPQQEPLRVPVQSNALLIVKRDTETKKFVKRVTHHATNEYYTITSR